ncbi:MAG: hypothetical protein WBF71_16605 [Microthrixaceae bacterium]
MKVRTKAVLVAAASLAPFLVGCATDLGDLGFAVTERDGVQELVIALCGSDPPGHLLIARGPTGGISGPAENAKFAGPSDENILFELRKDDWESDELTFNLGELSAAPASMQEFMVYSGSNNGLGWSVGSMTLPEGPWPTRPLALTSPFEFEREIRLDTERGNLCERR